MAGAHATAGRLLTALEQLAAEERACLLAGEESALAEVLARAGPLALRLGALVADPAVAPWRARIEAWLAGRDERWRALEASRRELQEGLVRLGEARGRLNRVLPAYGRSPQGSPVPRFHAAA